jgi:vacuolar iron transporter family protein
MSDAKQRPSLSSDDIKRYRANIRDETDGAALYRALADTEEDEHLAEVYRRLADTEDRHRSIWEGRLREVGSEVPAYKPSFRVRALGWIARRLGASAVAPIASRMEANAYAMYDNQPEAIEHGLPRDERSHARLFREISRAGVGREVPAIARIEGRHRAASGNAIRAAVLGANDGLVSNLSLVMGMAGANPGSDVVLVTGVAGLIAGALSMALGEWISVQNSAEYFRHQLKVERDEMDVMPEEEKEELTLIYQAKGFSEGEARELADRVFRDHDEALATLAREELGLGDELGGNPWTAAIVSFMTFGFGALMPVLPWFFFDNGAAVVGSLVLAGLALLATGALITFFTARNVWFSAGRMLLFGMACAAVTFGIGTAIGVGFDL